MNEQYNEVEMEGLYTAVLLERIALIAKLATYHECDHDEREIVAIWIAEMAVIAKEELLAVVFDVNGTGKIH
jgi:hypothetical protein